MVCLFSGVRAKRSRKQTGASTLPSLECEGDVGFRGGGGGVPLILIALSRDCNRGY